MKIQTKIVIKCKSRGSKFDVGYSFYKKQTAETKEKIKKAREFEKEVGFKVIYPIMEEIGFLFYMDDNLIPNPPNIVGEEKEYILTIEEEVK